MPLVPSAAPLPYDEKGEGDDRGRHDNDRRGTRRVARAGTLAHDEFEMRVGTDPVVGARTVSDV